MQYLLALLLALVFSLPAMAQFTTGVRKIVAGTNITISPSNGLGNVTINASGGSGGSYYADEVTLHLDTGSNTFSILALPDPSASTLGGIQSYASVSHQWISSISTLGVPASSQPAFSDISGNVTAAQSLALASGDVYIGNGSNQPAAASMATLTGDLSLATNAAQGAMPALAAGYIPVGITSGNATSIQIAGTTNQVTVTSATGAITVSLPSAITLPGTLTAGGTLAMAGYGITGSGSHTPTTAGGYDLGSTTKAWRNIYGTDSTDTTYYYVITPQALSGNVTVNIPAANSTTVQANSGTTHEFVTALSGTTGALTLAQPAFTDISAGSVTAAQMLALASGDVYIGNGSNQPAAATMTTLTSDLNLFSTSSTTQGLVPGSNSVGATYYLNGNGGWSIPAGGGGSGTVTSVATGTGLTGGTITTSGTISMATNTDNTLAGFNNSGAFSDVAIGTGLSLSSGTLSATGGGGGTNLGLVNAISAGNIPF